MNAEHRRGDAMNTNTKNKSQTTQKPYPYNVTRNEKLLKYLLEGYKLEKTVLRFNEHEIMVADVTLVRGKEIKVLKEVFGKDTPAGRKALREAAEVVREKTPSKKTRVGKTAKDRANGVLDHHQKNKNLKKDQNREAAANKGCGKGSGSDDSAKKAGLGKGQTKK